MINITTEELINELLTLKANAEAVSNSCDKLLKKLGPAAPKKKGALTNEEMARVLAKHRKTKLKQLGK